MKKTGILLTAAVIALAAYQTDLRLGDRGVRIDAAPGAKAFIRRVGRAISRTARRIGKAIKKGVRKVGSAIKKGVKKVGSAIKKGISTLAKGAFKSIKNFVQSIKDKLIAKMKSFAKPIYDKVNGLITGVLNEVISSLSAKLGFDLHNLALVIHPVTGKIDTNKIKGLIMEKINIIILPPLQDKARYLVNKGLALIKPLMDGAASAVIGAVGTIPFAGGALAAGLSQAYRIGREKLVVFATQGVSDMIAKFVSKWFNKGFDWLMRKVKPVKDFFDRVLVNVKKVVDLWKKAGMILQQ